VGPNHSLGRGLVNHSCDCPAEGCWEGDICYPAATFSVTFDVEELADAGAAIAFQRHQVTDGGGIAAMANVEMKKGTVTVDVAPGQLICLRSEETVDMDVNSVSSGEPGAAPLSPLGPMSVTVVRGSRARMSIASGILAGKAAPRLCVYRPDGSLVADISGKAAAAATAPIILDMRDSHGRFIAPGVYVFRLRAGQTSASCVAVLR
jgi:hypothetical protein